MAAREGKGSGRDSVGWIVSVQIAQNHEGVVSMMFASYPGAAPSEMSPHVIFESILAMWGAEATETSPISENVAGAGVGNNRCQCTRQGGGGVGGGRRGGGRVWGSMGVRGV